MEGHQGIQWGHDLPQTTVLVGQSFEPFKRLVLLRGPIRPQQTVGQSFEPFKRLVLLRGPIRPQQTNIFHHPNPLPNSQISHDLEKNSQTNSNIYGVKRRQLKDFTPVARLSGVTHILVHATYISYKRYLHHLEYEIVVTYIFLRFYRSQLKNVCSLISPTICVIVGRTVHLLYELNINNQLRLFIGDIGTNKHEPARVSAMLDVRNAPLPTSVQSQWYCYGVMNMFSN